MWANGFAIVFVTAPDLKTARKLTSAALGARLAACVNLIPKIESHYWWGGKITSDTEVLMVFKTRSSRVRALERLVLAKHPYEVPEFIAFELSSGNRRYLDWIKQSVAPNLKQQKSSFRHPQGRRRTSH
jgi:periplasmic divalent cation tolerance protein